LTSLVLAAAYLLLVLELVLMIGRWAGYPAAPPLGPVVKAMMSVTVFGLVWRAVFRVGFTTAEYGISEGLRAFFRIPVANIIAIMAGRRALYAYIKGLFGEAVIWEKTTHSRHPAEFAKAEVRA
jgi:adsorption protein B